MPKVIQRLLEVKHLLYYIVFFLFCYLPIMLYPLESDHWIYLYIGKRFFEGAKLYTDMFDTNAPMFFLFNGLLSQISLNIWIDRLILSLLAITSTIIFYKLTRHFLNSLVLDQVSEDNFTIVSMTIFIFFTFLTQIYGNGNTADTWGLPCMLLLIYFYFTSSIHERIYKYFVIGFLTGLIIFLKPFWLLLIIPFLVDFYMKNKTGLLSFSKGPVGLFISGLAVIPGFWIYYFYTNNNFSDVSLIFFNYNFRYIIAAWQGYVSSPYLVLMYALLFFSVPILIFFLWGKKRIFDPNMFYNYQQRFWAYFGFFGILLWFGSGTYNPYYLMIIVPSVAISCGYWMYETSLDFSNPKTNTLLALLVLVILFNLGFSITRTYTFVSGASQADFDNIQYASDYIYSKTSQNIDLVDLYGHGASLYILSNRNGASRFLSVSHMLLDERAKMGLGFTNQWINEMEKNKTKYIMTTPAMTIFVTNVKAADYIEKNYKQVKAFGDYKVYERK